jgi:Ca-activated chloride channel family protein
MGGNGWEKTTAVKAVCGALCISAISVYPDFPAFRGHPAFPAPPGLAAQPAQEVFHSASAELVVLPIVVKDKQGRYVADLPRERFVVYDNARRVPIELFTAEDTPVTIGLIVDGSGSMRTKLGEVIAATLRFAKASNPNDELFAIRFNDDVREVLEHRQFLLAEDAMDLEAAMSSIVPEGRTALYDALIAGLDHLNQGTRPRKALIVISDGGDNASRTSLDAVLARARKSNATIYTIGIFDDDDPDRNPGVLKSLARETGGERFLPRSAGALLQVCERMAREIRSGYTVGYVPPDRDGLFHRVRVDIAPAVQHFEIRTRPGYFAAGRAGSQP